MTFDVHVNELNKKVVGTLMHIHRIRLNLEKRTLIIVVHSLVLSSQLLHQDMGHNKRNLNEKRSKTIRHRSQSNGGQSQKIRPRFPHNKGTKGKHILDTCTTMFKTMHGSCPEWLLPCRTVNEATGSITTQNNRLYVRRTITDTGVLGGLLYSDQKYGTNCQLTTKKHQTCKYMGICLRIIS